ncbi:hypothetical protein FQN50_002048 [Emmonsiellopsis sp. PD_5]|nr:hypothetical protein FQN50_002048 [Emmonsiellopsis sp. PD_5]
MEARHLARALQLTTTSSSRTLRLSSAPKCPFSCPSRSFTTAARCLSSTAAPSPAPRQRQVVKPFVFGADIPRNNADKLDSLSKVLDNFDFSSPRRSSPAGQQTSRSKDSTPSSTSTSDNNLSDSAHLSVLASDVRRTVIDLPRARQQGQVDMRLTPSLGRTVPVDAKAGVDLARAFQQLEKKCRVNEVKNMAMAQRFYVRRGQMKKKLKRDRWAKLFKAGFKHTIDRCQRLRKQGW